MNRRSYLRLVVGAFCLFLAVLIAVLDFLDGVHFTGKPQEPLPAPEVVTRDSHEPAGIPAPSLPGAETPAEVDVCEMEGAQPCEVDETLQVQRGDTIASVLARADIDQNQASDVIEQLKKVFNPRELRTEHEVYITYLPLREGPVKKDLKALYLRPSIETEIYVRRDKAGGFVATREKKKLKQKSRIARGTIENSLYIDAGKQNVPPKILHEMIQAFSYDVDFQRSFHSGDGYGIMYDTWSDPDSLREESGDLLFAELQLQDKTYKIYRFRNSAGLTGFYNEKGESIKKGLLRTPIDGARISSTFGNRRHPILGYTKMHKGVDFAAPVGTPIMAAGDGVVVKAVFFSSYGNYVLIRHNHEFSTAYAHLSRFARGLKPGSRVRQGQIIGHVGSTGRTSGPHLHYEVLRFDRQINPNSIKMLPAGKLGGRELSAFKAMIGELDRKYKAVKPSSTAEENAVSVAEPIHEANSEKNTDNGKTVQEPPKETVHGQKQKTARKKGNKRSTQSRPSIN